MKITVIEGNNILNFNEDPQDVQNQIPGWYLISDSAWTNAGKPFFYPENTDLVHVSLAPVIRANRLGKYIAKKFASRYYSEFAPALHFTLPTLRSELIFKGLSPEPAVSFDRSLIVGSFTPIPETENNSLLQLKINGETVATWNHAGMKFSIDDIIAGISKTNTVKMGDFIIPVLCGSYPVKIGDFLEVTGQFTTPLTVKVK